MEDLLNKISSYNILNNIIPGAVFVYFWSALDVGAFPSCNVIESRACCPCICPGQCGSYPLSRYNPSLKLAIDIARIVEAPIEEIFVFK